MDWKFPVKKDAGRNVSVWVWKSRGMSKMLAGIAETLKVSMEIAFEKYII